MIRNDDDLAIDIEAKCANTKPSRTEERRRVVEEYVNDLKEILRELRRRLFH